MFNKRLRVPCGGMDAVLLLASSEIRSDDHTNQTMGLANRDYQNMPSHQAYGKMPKQPGRLDGCPVVKWLLISNIAIFFLDKIFGYALFIYGHHSVGTVFYEGEIWRLLSFQFLHSHENGMHLIFNMVALFMFGSFVERWWGSRKFIVFYLACGCAGALFSSLLYYLGVFGKGVIDLGDGVVFSDAYYPAVGASAGIYGCLIAVAVIAPNLVVRLLFPPIPMKMKTLALGVLGIAVVVTFGNLNNAGGEAGHLGGAILGFILMKKPRLLSWIGDGSTKKNKRKTLDATIVREKKIRPRININLDDSEIDRILDKVSSEGLQSLTQAEKDVLNRRAGK